ncbi:elongation of very long chain fatty acids protein 7 [Orussus abietinus]|uniref:elongation of very long chain fatty acids protein 7 n=1 Tax=Orussus abietinus TaxID=222816 RepID=UPI00062518BD|nr:elongation of very long chain fatty acids protein 7 [Orussus abietinus]
MASLIRSVVSNYDEIIKTNKDPKVDTWLLMGSPGPVFCILAMYLAFVIKIGPKLMEKRPPFELKTVMIVYNAIQVVFSIWLSSLVFRHDLKQLLNSNCANPNVLTQSAYTELYSAAWWYFFAKIVELMDTVIFVLRKKNNQVTFLHVYHHTVTALFSWCYLKLAPGEQGIVLGFLNSTVHIIMYAYYMIAAMGPKYRKYIWWKKYMTWIQLIQFGLMLSYLVFVLAMDCKMPKGVTYFFVTNVVIFIYLFSDFYRKAYKKKQA